VRTPGELYRSLRFPIWQVAIVALSLYCAWVYRLMRHRRLIPPSHCRECGYDLTGNLSGVCPECGVRIQADRIEKGRSVNGSQA